MRTEKMRSMVLVVILCLQIYHSATVRASCLRVVSILYAPYLMSSKSDPQSSGGQCPTTTDNEQFTGFVKDYLDHMAARANFTYQIQLSKDGLYGMMNDNKVWIGMVGELINNETDVIAAPLTRTDQRDRVIDFLQPFDNVEPVLIYSKKSPPPTITSVDDLLDSSYAFGVVASQSVYDYLRLSAVASHRRLFEYFTNHEDQLPKTYNEGIARVRSGNGAYLFIAPNTASRMQIYNEPCDLGSQPIGFSRTGEGFAVRTGSPLKQVLDTAHKSMVDDGVLSALKYKWWKMESCTNGSILTTKHSVALLGLILMMQLTFLG